MPGRAANLRGMQQGTLLDLAGVAARAGVRVATMRDYHYLASRARREGTSRPGDLPAPDGKFGRSPVWELATVEQWLRSRPGRGAGGGRPVGWRRRPAQPEV